MPFPKWLEKMVNNDVLNYGVHGHSNGAIADDLFRFIYRHSHIGDLDTYSFLIVMSAWDRATLAADDPYYKKEPLRPTANPERLRGEVQDFTLLDNSNVHPLRMATETAYLGMKYILDYHKLPYRMINSHCTQLFSPYKAIWETKWDNSLPGVSSATDYIVGKRSFPFITETMVDDPNWIEYNKPCNTLLDICGGTWLGEEPKYWDWRYTQKRHKDEFAKGHNKYFTPCMHPNIGGHKLIAETLEPYLKPILE
jgi:hypothetical protein